MATEAELNIQLEALKKARRSGLKVVQFADRRMEYRSDKELADAIRDLEDEIAEVQSGGRRKRRFYTTTSKGL